MADPYDLDTEDVNLKGSFQEWASVVKVTGRDSKYKPVVKNYPGKKATSGGGSFFDRMKCLTTKRLQYTPAFWKNRKGKTVETPERPAANEDSISIQSSSSESEDDIPTRESLNHNLRKINYQPGRKRPSIGKVKTPGLSGIIVF